MPFATTDLLMWITCDFTGTAYRGMDNLKNKTKQNHVLPPLPPQKIKKINKNKNKKKNQHPKAHPQKNPKQQEKNTPPPRKQTTTTTTTTTKTTLRLERKRTHLDTFVTADSVSLGLLLSAITVTKCNNC